MDDDTQESGSDVPTPDVKRGARRWLLREIFGVVFVAVLLFVTAGTWTWPMGWALVGLYAVWVAANALLLMPTSPGLLAERATHRKSDKAWDNVLLGIFGVAVLVKYVVAGLDLRFGWPPSLPLALQIAALLLAAAGYALVSWSMVANAYFSVVVRMQRDRHQVVASGGPYRYVRHPGYTGSILFELMTPLALGSLWALIPGVVSAVVFVVRTALEDRTLHQELPGYPAFAQRTRHRLLPGIW